MFGGWVQGSTRWVIWTLEGLNRVVLGFGYQKSGQFCSGPHLQLPNHVQSRCCLEAPGDRAKGCLRTHMERKGKMHQVTGGWRQLCLAFLDLSLRSPSFMKEIPFTAQSRRPLLDSLCCQET